MVPSRCKKFDVLKAWILACTLIANASYATIAPFLPIEIENKGISTIWMAPIFAISSVGIIVFSPCVSKLVPWLGAANVMALGMAGMGISLACFGLMMFSINTKVIIVSALLARFVQGAASAFIQTACYIITTNDYPNDQEKIIGLMEAMTGAGYLLGPVIGSALYAVTDFETTFLLFGGFLVATAFAIYYGFPKTSSCGIRSRKPTSKQSCHINQESDSDIDKNEETTCSAHTDLTCMEDSQILGDVEQATCDVSVDSAPSTSTTSTAEFTPTSSDDLMVVSYWQLAKLARVSLGLMGAAMCLFMYCFLEPILSQRLLDFQLSVPQIGLFFALFPIFYIPTSACVQWIPDWIEKRVTIALSLLVSSFAFLLVGPSTILPFPDSLLMMGLGWCLLGISLATFLVPILPEMVESSLVHFSASQEKQVNNMCSGMFNSFLGIGQLIAPLYGSIVSDRLGFRWTTDIAAMIGFTFFIIYFVFADVRQSLQNSFAVVVKPESTTTNINTTSSEQIDADDMTITI